MDRTIRDVAIVLAVAGMIFLANLGGARLWDHEEALNAGCAAEMLAAGDWVVPIFNAELQPRRPVLSCWFIMLSYATFGVTEFAARLPSALLGLGTCLLTFGIGRWLFGSSAGVWSAVILSTTMMFGIVSRTATPDASLVFFSTLAIALYVYGTTQKGAPGIVREFPAGWIVPCLIFASLGMAVLAKGLVGALVPSAVIGLSLLIRRLPASRRQYSSAWEEVIVESSRPFAPPHMMKTFAVMRPLLGIVTVAAVASPWLLMVYARTDGAWPAGDWTSLLSIQTSTGYSGGLTFHPLMLLIGFFPWSIFCIPVIVHAFKMARRDDSLSAGAVLGLCWAGVSLAMFSFSRNKLPGDLIACYPGLAVLTGMSIDHYARGLIHLPALWRRLSFGALISVGLVIAIATPMAAQTFWKGESLFWLLAVIPVIGGAMALWHAEKGKQLFACRWTASTAIALSFGLFVMVVDRVDKHRHIEDLVATVYSDPERQELEIASLSNTEGSWVYYLMQPISQLKTQQEAMQFLQEKSPTGKQRVLVTTANRMTRDDAISPLSAFVVGRIPYFMHEDEIVVLKPASIIHRSAEAPNPYEIR